MGYRQPRDGRTQMGIHTTLHRSPISLPPGIVLGYRADGRPIRIIAGGSEDGDAPDIEVEVDDAPDTEPVDEAEPEIEPDVEDAPKPKPPVKKTDAEYKAPSKDEWARTQAALKKANDDAKRHRLRNKELEDKVRGDETEHEKALREAREEGERRFREPMKKSGVRAALAEAGFTAPDRLMKLIDWDAITVDDEGDLIGAEAEVDRVKADYPELLPQEKPKAKVRPTGAPRAAAVEKPKSTAEQHANRILGRA
jgi:hypothetical protein